MQTNRPHFKWIWKHHLHEQRTMRPHLLPQSKPYLHSTHQKLLFLCNFPLTNKQFLIFLSLHLCSITGMYTECKYWFNYLRITSTNVDLHRRRRRRSRHHHQARQHQVCSLIVIAGNTNVRSFVRIWETIALRNSSKAQTSIADCSPNVAHVIIIIGTVPVRFGEVYWGT